MVASKTTKGKIIMKNICEHCNESLEVCDCYLCGHCGQPLDNCKCDVCDLCGELSKDCDGSCGW